MIGNPDCFAYTPNCKCSALKEMLCKNHKSCPFYKSNNEITKAEIEQAVLHYGTVKLNHMIYAHKGVIRVG